MAEEIWRAASKLTKLTNQVTSGIWDINISGASIRLHVISCISQRPNVVLVHPPLTGGTFPIIRSCFMKNPQFGGFHQHDDVHFFPWLPDDTSVTSPIVFDAKSPAVKKTFISGDCPAPAMAKARCPRPTARSPGLHSVDPMPSAVENKRGAGRRVKNGTCLVEFRSCREYIGNTDIIVGNSDL